MKTFIRDWKALYYMKKIFSFPASIHTKDVAGLAQSVELLTGDGEVEESIPATESKLKFFKKK